QYDHPEQVELPEPELAPELAPDAELPPPWQQVEQQVQLLLVPTRCNSECRSWLHGRSCPCLQVRRCRFRVPRQSYGRADWTWCDEDRQRLVLCRHRVRMVAQMVAPASAKALVALQLLPLPQVFPQEPLTRTSQQARAFRLPALQQLPEQQQPAALPLLQLLLSPAWLLLSPMLFLLWLARLVLPTLQQPVQTQQRRRFRRRVRRSLY